MIHIKNNLKKKKKDANLLAVWMCPEQEHTSCPWPAISSLSQGSPLAVSCLTASGGSHRPHRINPWASQNLTSGSIASWPFYIPSPSLRSSLRLGSDETLRHIKYTSNKDNTTTAAATKQLLGTGWVQSIFLLWWVGKSKTVQSRIQLDSSCKGSYTFAFKSLNFSPSLSSL